MEYASLKLRNTEIKFLLLLIILNNEFSKISLFSSKFILLYDDINKENHFYFTNRKSRSILSNYGNPLRSIFETLVFQYYN